MSNNGYELFFGRQSPFSHDHACNFTLEDRDFHCMEQYMEYKKAEVFGDENVKYQVLNSWNTAEIKRLGRQVKDFDILKWMKVAVDIVKAGNKAKFSQNDYLKRELYKTCPKQMVEASPSDTRWGIGLSADRSDAQDESRWRGRNLLGKLLTNLRDEMMQGEGKIKERTLPLLESDQSAIEQQLLEENEKIKLKFEGRGHNKRSEKRVQSERFEFFSGDESPFSNYHQADFEVNGVKFFCIEQFMLFRKADLFEDEKAMAFTKNMKCRRDFKVKIPVKKFDGREWTEKRKDIYKQGVTEKFKQSPDLMKILLETSPKIILKASPEGKDYILSHPYQFRKEEWIDNGHWFEFALMEVRDRFLEKHKTSHSLGNADKEGDYGHAGEHSSKKTAEKDTPNPPDEYVGDVSNLFDETRSMNSESCLENEASSSKSSVRRSHDKMEIKEYTRSSREQNWRSDSQSKFEFFWGDESPFSNYHQADFEVDDVKFSCIEQYMLYRKADLFGDEKAMAFTKNMNCRRDFKVKIPVKKFDGSDGRKWTEKRKDIYKQGVTEKFKQSPDLMKILLETSPKIILKASPEGKDYILSHPYQFRKEEWIDNGHWFEFALMEVRDRFLEKHKTSHSLGNADKEGDYGHAGEHSSKKTAEKDTPNPPDEYVGDVSNLFDETRSMNSESCLENEASSSKSSVRRSHDKMEIKEYTRSSREQNWRSDSQSKFEFFWGDESPFSNYHQADFEVDDVKFSCIEQYMLYRKADLFGDEKAMAFTKNMNCRRDFKVKIPVKKFDGSDGRKWTEKRKDIYKQGVTEKFNQNPDLMKILLETSPKIILKASRKDKDYLLSHPDQFRKEEWIDDGHWYEFALMEVRDRFVEKDTPNPADENVNDVSNNLDENLQIQSKNGQKAAKSSEPNHLEQMEVDEEEKHTKSEPKMDWFENEASTSQTSHSKHSHSKKGQKESPRSEDSSQSPAKTAKKEKTPKKVARTPKGHTNKDQSSGNDKSMSQNVSNSGTNADDKYYHTIIDNSNALSFEAKCKFTIGDIEFKSVEHYAAYRKADLFADEYTKDKIRKSDDSEVIRRLQRVVKNVNYKKWYENHADIYREACRAKFSQNPELKLKLFDTYPTVIYKSGKSSKGRVTEVDYKMLDKQDRNNKQDLNNVLNDVRDELMQTEGLID